MSSLVPDSPPTVIDLPELVSRLPLDGQAAFERLFALSLSEGRLKIPATMRGWVETQFGSLDSVAHQHIIRVTDRWTLESTSFNPLRASRPHSLRDGVVPLSRDEERPFAEPEAMTPEDVFGRIRGTHVVTASNVAKQEGFHGLVIFQEPDPLAVTPPVFSDALDVAMEWFARCHAEEPAARHPMIIWNAGARAGASLSHAHLQLTLARDEPYGAVLRLCRAARDYRAAHERDYFSDIFAVHDSLGLGWRHSGIEGLIRLTPVKERECWLIGRAVDGDFKGALHDLLRRLIEGTGMQTFNLALIPPPLSHELQADRDWPVLARVVDRGDPGSLTGDIGAMELFGVSVVSSDPFGTARLLFSKRARP